MTSKSDPLEWEAPDFPEIELAAPANDDFDLNEADLRDLDGFAEGPPVDAGGEESVAEPALPPSVYLPGGDASLADQPLPRIRIHAFSDRSDMRAMIESLGADRRMSKTLLTVEPGGIDAATVYCSSNPSPNLLILDTIDPPADLLAKIDRLAEYVEEGTKVVILGAANDIGLFRELMKRGVSEYLVPPLEKLQLIRAISALYVSPDKPFAGRLISVIGAKGGVGSSTIAHNIAWLFAERMQANTTLVDLDLSFGTTALDFNQDPQQTIAEALVAPERVDEVFLDRLLVRHTERLMLFCAPGTVEKELDVEVSAYESVIDRVRRSAPFVVCDLPHVWSPWVAQTLQGSDDILIVTTPDLAGLRNAKNLFDRLKATRPNDNPPTIIVNMMGMPKRPEIPMKDFGDALGAEPALVLPFDPHTFGMAANNGQMAPEFAPQAKVSTALEGFAATLCGRTPVARRSSSVLDRIPFLKR